MNRNALIYTSAICALVAPDLAHAGEKPLIAPAPAWVTPAPALDPAKLAAAKVAIPLFDEQTLVDGDATVQFIDSAFTINNQATLNQLGTISVEWQPQHGDLTFHAAEILRDGEKIDLLKTGPGFTVLRREAKLEKLTIDGELTAMMPAQGLRVGDVLHVSYSISVRDTALAGRAQTAQIVFPKPITLQFGRARLVWPEKQKLAWKALAPGMALEPKPIAGGMTELVVTMPIAKFPELPENIPARFSPVPLIEASSFANWQDVASVMAPLFSTEGAIAEGSDLAKVTDAIAAAHKDPVERMAAALRTVQDDVRYQLVTLGNGNYVPQKPADTWSMRFGDCKAKTMLLLAMLHRLGIMAEPVLANSTLGDLVPDRLPSAQAFDHVFVRAEIGGESFWLDGTKLGDRIADIRDVPRFGNVLPLRTKGAALIKLPTRADARPAMDLTVSYDGQAGLHLPVPFTMKLSYTGYRAEQRRAEDNNGTEDSLLEFIKGQTEKLLDTTTITKPRSSYDKEAGRWTAEVSGLAYPGWDYKDGHWTIEYGPAISVEFDPDRSKSTWRQLPALIKDPWTSRSSWSLALPQRAAAAVLEGSDAVSVNIPALAYSRTIKRTGLTVENIETAAETGAEVAPTEIGAVRKTVSDLSEKKLRIIAPADYPQRWDEVAALAGSPALKRIIAVFDQRIADDPKDAVRYADRGWMAKRLFDWAGAEANYTKAIELDPTVERYLDRAGVRSSIGNDAGVLADAKAAYDLDNDNKDARAWMAVALRNTGDTDGALDYVDADPDPATEDGESALSSRALILAQGGRGRDALDLLNAAITRRPSSSPLLNDRCWMQGLANINLDAALADCNKAIELASDPAEVFDSRAMVHFRAGRFAEAKKDLDAALAIAPEMAASRFMRAVIALREGDKATAAANFNAARKVSPSIDKFFARFGIKP